LKLSPRKAVVVLIGNPTKDALVEKVAVCRPVNPTSLASIICWLKPLLVLNLKSCWATCLPFLSMPVTVMVQGYGTPSTVSSDATTQPKKNEKKLKWSMVESA